LKGNDRFERAQRIEVGNSGTEIRKHSNGRPLSSTINTRHRRVNLAGPFLFGAWSQDARAVS
jgi:hypothetical protein